MSEQIDTVEELDALPQGTVIREVREEGVTWKKEGWLWRCIAGFVPGIGQPLFPVEVITRGVVTHDHAPIAAQPLNTDWTMPPGQLLKEELAARGITDQYGAAELLGVPQQQVSRLYLGQARISAAFALRLEKLGFASAEFWVKAEALFKLDVERGKQVWTKR